GCRVSVFFKRFKGISVHGEVNRVALEGFAWPKLSSEKGLMGQEPRAPFARTKFGRQIRPRFASGEKTESQRCVWFSASQRQQSGAAVGFFVFPWLPGRGKPVRAAYAINGGGWFACLADAPGAAIFLEEMDQPHCAERNLVRGVVEDLCPEHE